MKVIGIGNAIIDVLCKVEENFLIRIKDSSLIAFDFFGPKPHGLIILYI